MSKEYTEAEKMIYASYVMLEVAAMNAENEIRKSNGQPIKFIGRDYDKCPEYAHRRMRGW